MDKFPSIKKVKTIDLIPYARNSRTHSDEQINQIAASIKEFGFLNPIIIDGENGIIAGHGRVMAANKLNIKELPCVDASHLSETQRRAYVIADNKLALNSGWDIEMLRVEFDELQEAGFDLELTGFSMDGTKWMNWSSAYSDITACGSSSGGRRPASPFAASMAAPIMTSAICTAGLVFESTWVTDDNLRGKRMPAICVCLNSTSS